MRTCPFEVWCLILGLIIMLLENQEIGVRVAMLAPERKLIVIRVTQSPLCVIAVLIMNRNSLPSRG